MHKVAVWISTGVLSSIALGVTALAVVLVNPGQAKSNLFEVSRYYAVGFADRDGVAITNQNNQLIGSAIELLKSTLTVMEMKNQLRRNADGIEKTKDQIKTKQTAIGIVESHKIKQFCEEFFISTFFLIQKRKFLIMDANKSIKTEADLNAAMPKIIIGLIGNQADEDLIETTNLTFDSKKIAPNVGKFNEIYEFEDVNAFFMPSNIDAPQELKDSGFVEFDIKSADGEELKLYTAFLFHKDNKDFWEMFDKAMIAKLDIKGPTVECEE